MKLGLREERRFFESFKNDLRFAKIDTHKVITEPNLHIFFEDRISSVRAKLSKQVKNKHRQKLCFLLEKEGRQIPSFLFNNPLSQSNSKKKSRKFIKRNRFRRKKRQLDKKMQAPIVTNYSDKILTKDM